MSNASKIAFVFPGQGAQSVGMGHDFFMEPAGRRIYEVFNREVSSDLSTICFEGPEETLRRTLYTQPAILATSLAALAVFLEKCPIQPTLVAGHSLGEYGALYAAGVISLEASAQLIKQRCQLMEEAPAGAMSAVLGLAALTITRVLSDYQIQHHQAVIAVANDNSDSQVVISGQPEAIEAVAPLLKAAGAKRVLSLPVGGAFHSPLMASAAKTFAETLNQFPFNEARCPVISNVDAMLACEGEHLREKLSRQIESPVCWTPTMRRMQEEGVDTVIEFGPGKVLTGLFGRVCPEFKLFNVFDLASATAVSEALAIPIGV